MPRNDLLEVTQSVLVESATDHIWIALHRLIQRRVGCLKRAQPLRHRLERRLGRAFPMGFQNDGELRGLLDRRRRLSQRGIGSSLELRKLRHCVLQQSRACLLAVFWDGLAKQRDALGRASLWHARLLKGGVGHLNGK